MAENQTPNDIHLDADISRQMTIHKNISQEIIIVNIDKVKLILNEHQQNVQKKKDRINPLALFLTLFVTNITAEFTDTWGLGKDTWKAIFVLVCVASFLWLLYSVYNACTCKGDNIEYVIEKLKQSSAEHHD